MATAHLPNRWPRIAFTILPFVVYLIALRIPLPTYHVTEVKGMRDWSDFDNIVAVGIMPWVMAAVAVEIVTLIVHGGQRLRQEGGIGSAELRRTTNIFGLLFAVVHASWITFDLSVEPFASIIDPSVDVYFPKPHVSSPILAFVTLLAGAICCKLLVDFVGPRSFLGEHGRLLAVGLLLSTIYTLTRENSPFYSMDIRIMDLIRIGVNLLKCGMLVSFFLLRPQFLPPPTITTDNQLPTPT